MDHCGHFRNGVFLHKYSRTHEIQDSKYWSLHILRLIMFLLTVKQTHSRSVNFNWGQCCQKPERSSFVLAFFFFHSVNEVKHGKIWTVDNLASCCLILYLLPNFLFNHPSSFSVCEMGVVIHILNIAQK